MGSEHGGLNYEQLRKENIRPEDVLDFSVSINPDPLPVGMRERIRNACITRYPDSNCSLLKEKIKDYNELEDTASILVVNGTSQGMFLIVNALLQENDPVSIAAPTYSEYYDACSLKTEAVNFVSMTEDEGFHFSLARIAEHLEISAPRLLWLCSPNNPTGIYLKEQEFEAVRKICIRTNTILLLDEAYVCFVPDSLRYNSAGENVIVLRSMTKDFSIPGLRLGYLMGDPELIERIKKWQPEWSISSPAQEAGIAGFEEINYFKNSWKRTVSRQKVLRKSIENLGLKTYPSFSNFFLTKVQDIEKLKKHLWKDLIIVRDCRSFGLENIIRIGSGTDEANSRLLRSLKEYMHL
jgi:histidinol-phosphate aminotransferase